MTGIFNQAFGGGVAIGNNLANNIKQFQRESQLEKLADLARGGLGNQQNANELGAGLIALGQVNAGINAQNVPYNREQQALDRQRRDEQQAFNNAILLGNKDIARARLTIAENAANQPKPAPDGYIWNEPGNPSAGVTPIPGIQQATPKPLSPAAGIIQDYRNGLIDEETRDLQLANATAPKNRLTVTTSPDGTTTTSVGGRSSAKAPTEGQAKANIYASRAEASNQILGELDAQGTDLQQVLIGNLPLGNFVNTPKFQEYKQAQRDFINAILRQESGAVIAPSEFANAQQQYFPQPGDNPGVIEQKRQNRAIAIRTIRQASGPFADVQPSPVGIQGKSQDNPIVLQNEAQAENLAPGTFISINGRVGVIEE